MFDRLEHFFRNQDNMITLVAVLSASTVTTTFLQFFSGAYVLKNWFFFVHFFFFLIIMAKYLYKQIHFALV